MVSSSVSLVKSLPEVHLDNEEERQNWLTSGGMEKCTQAVEKTAQMLCEYIEKM
jgi:hypothetical protein